MSHPYFAGVLRELKADRAERADIREETVRTQVRGFDVLTGWRGRSSKRTVFSVYDIESAQAAGAATVEPVLVLAISRDSRGIASIYSARSYGAGDGRFPLWLATVAGRGCTELHVCRTLPDAAARDAVLRDLRPAPAALAEAA